MEPATKRFSQAQAKYLLAHSTDYEHDSVEVEERTFCRLMGMAAPAPHPFMSPDDENEPAPERDYAEWEAYFRADVDSGATDIIFNRAMLEEDAGMSAHKARHLYGKTKELGEIAHVASR